MTDSSDSSVSSSSPDPNRCRVIGVLDDGVASLGATALAHLRTADVVIGGARTLALFGPAVTGVVRTRSASNRSHWLGAARIALTCFFP